MDERLKPCPFCGKKVELIKEPLWHGSHGYYDCYEYVVKCRNPECQCQIYLDKNNTIYYDDETAQRNAIEAWNRRADGEDRRTFYEVIERQPTIEPQQSTDCAGCKLLKEMYGSDTDDDEDEQND